MDDNDSHLLLHFLHITQLGGFLLHILSGSGKAFAYRRAISRFVLSQRICQSHFALRQEANRLNEADDDVEWVPHLSAGLFLLISECGEIARP